ncbi:MAG TPA: glycosyltransferase family 2 protein, partial [Fimbriimonadaceae bacterium]|nr:glycosyltransferase family 2 protein [Fimbriimonadaceae bacterium]
VLVSPDVSVLIVNFRTKELTADAVQSALAEPECHEVVVVDNASGDESVAFLEERFRSENRVKVVASGENRGFGAGNNLAAAESSGRYLFLLNSDALCLPGCLAQLRERLESDSSIGLVAPSVYLPGQKSLQPDVSGWFPTVPRLLTRSVKRAPDPEEPEWVGGAALLARRSEFLDLGGFDEDLFMYLEDVLLCWHYRKRGFRIVREPAAGIIHLGGASMKSDWDRKARYYAAQDQYLRKTGASSLGIFAVRMLRWPAFVASRLLGKA